MNLRRLYTVLVVWCALMFAPGVLLETNIFGRFDAKTDVSGTVILVWLVGYLAQFAIFLWIMNIVRKQKILWWFAASLIPWAIDWTLPVSPLYHLLWFPIVIALAAWIALDATRDESLQRQGVRATGVVLEIFKPRMNVVINNVYTRRKIRLRIERRDGVPAYEGILKGLFMLGEIPSVGARIPLVVDPARPNRFEYDQRAESGVTAKPAAASATSEGGIADDLERLARLRDRGAITETEFNAAKRKLLR